MLMEVNAEQRVGAQYDGKSGAIYGGVGFA